MEIKCCNKCKEEKPQTLEFFGRKTKSIDGFHPWCKVCVSDYNKTDIIKNAIKKYRKTDKGTLIHKEANKRWNRTEGRKKSAKLHREKLGSGVYEITNLLTGTSYIGYAQELQARRDAHFSYYKKHNGATCANLQNDMKLYSKDAFSFFIIEHLPRDKKLLEQREEYWISKLNPKYNIKTS